MTVKKKATVIKAEKEASSTSEDSLGDVLDLWKAKAVEEAVLLERIHKCGNPRLVMHTLRAVLLSNVVHMMLGTISEQLRQSAIRAKDYPEESPARTILCSLHLLHTHLLKTHAIHCPQHSVQHILALVARAIYSNALWPGNDKERLSCAFHLQRLCASLKQHGKTWRDTAMYLVGSMVESQHIQGTTSSPPVYSMLAISIYALLDLCDQHALATLASQLPKHERVILKHLNQEFTKYHKFNGVI